MSGTAELAIICGRRQIGKSELVRQSIADRDDAVYYQAVKEQRRHNSGDSSRQQRRPIQTSRPSKRWEPLLTYLTDRDAVIVIDEFPYLIESNEGLPRSFNICGIQLSTRVRRRSYSQALQSA